MDQERWLMRCARLPTGVLPSLWRTVTARTQNALRTHREGSNWPRTSECSANWQCSRRTHRWSSVELYEIHVATQHRSSAAKRQARGARCRDLDLGDEHHSQAGVCAACGRGKADGLAWASRRLGHSWTPPTAPARAKSGSRSGPGSRAGRRTGPAGAGSGRSGQRPGRLPNGD